MIIQDQFGTIQNLQRALISQTSYWSGIIFCPFLQQTGSSSIVINTIKSINIFQIENATSKKDEILEGRRKKALEDTAEKYKELNLQECSSNVDLDDYCKKKESNGSEKESLQLDIRSGGPA